MCVCVKLAVSFVLLCHYPVSAVFVFKAGRRTVGGKNPAPLRSHALCPLLARRPSYLYTQTQ